MGLCVSVSLRESVCVSPWVWVSVRVCVTVENLCASVEVFLYVCVSLRGMLGVFACLCVVCLCQPQCHPTIASQG